MPWSKGSRHTAETRARISEAIRTANYIVKSCGEAHAYCRVCRPEAGIKRGLAFKGYKHSPETRAKMSAARRGHPGHPQSVETRAKIGLRSAAKKGSFVYGIAMAGIQRAKGMNRYETFVHDVLLADFPEVVWQQPFGSYVVDFYLPHPYHLAIEVDSWIHNISNRKESDTQRDVWLLQEVNLPIVRLKHRELEKLMEV